MSHLSEQFRQWVLSQHIAGTLPEAIDDEHVRIRTAWATAEVNLYPFVSEGGEDGGDDIEIVEYRIVRDDGDATFYLHFQLEDMSRAQELFEQMKEALVQEKSREPSHILLCCTSALTTTLFASKMNDIAQTLSLDYDFRAMSLQNALATTEPFIAILLAPQTAHVRKQMMEAHPDALVFEIPAKIFGAYDAAGALRLLMHALHEVDELAVPFTRSLRAVRNLHDRRNVLVITLFSLRDHTRLGYRLYRNGEAFFEGAVRKPELDYHDIKDLVQTLSMREVDVRTLDAIGIAVPGVTYRGTVSLPGIIRGNFDLGVALSKRFNLPVYVDNNCNAAAVGCYVSQTECENLLFYRHAFGHAGGGMGTVIDGKLLKGHGNFAGEPKYFEPNFVYDMDYADLLWSADGMHRLALNVAVASTAIVAPDALYLAVDTVDDAEAFQCELARIIGKANAPKVYVVQDYVERVYLGMLALSLQKLHDPKEVPRNNW